MRLLPRAALLAAALSLAACSGGGSGGSGTASSSSSGGTASSGSSSSGAASSGSSSGATGAYSLQGSVKGGGHAIAGAALSLYAAGANGYGNGVAPLATTTTDGAGSWSLSFDCATGDTLLYLVAAGGDPGNGANSAIALSSAPGTCTNTSGGSYVIDEITTVASSYALAPFLDGSGRAVGSSAGNRAGLDHAYTMAALLADLHGGTALTTLPGGGNGSLPTATLDSLGNLLAGCIDDHTTCAALFGQATADGAAAPADLLQAALSIARHPANHVAALYTQAASTALWQPALTAAPGDWTLALQLNGGGLQNPSAIAIDAQGDAWVANYNGGAVSKFSASAQDLSGGAGFSGGGLRESLGIAVDGQGHAWVTNEESPATVNNALGSITELAADGSILSGASGYIGGGIDFPQAVAVDAGGNVWIVNYGDGAHASSLSKLGPDGTALSPTQGYTGAGLAFPVSLAIAADGSLWAANQGADSVSALSASGAALSPAAGYAAGQVAYPFGICIDPSGHVWVAASIGNAMVELAGPASTTPGSVLSPAGGFSGGGLASPSTCAADGGGNIWVSNYHGTSVTELAGGASVAPGAFLSGPSGYQHGNLSLPTGLAIDASGNVWIADSGDSRIVVLIGAATPVTTPRLGSITQP